MDEDKDVDCVLGDEAPPPPEVGGGDVDSDAEEGEILSDEDDDHTSCAPNNADSSDGERKKCNNTNKDKQRLLLQLMQQMAQLINMKGVKQSESKKTVDMIDKLMKNDSDVDSKELKELIRKNRSLLRSSSRERESRGKSRSPSRSKDRDRDRRSRDTRGTKRDRRSRSRSRGRRSRSRSRDRRSRSRSRDRSSINKSSGDGLPPGPQTKEKCKFFAEGKCLKGHECPYSHEIPIPKKREICKFYLQGFCGKADHCNYMHGEFPCKFFHTGAECYAGDKCRFSHQPLTEEGREVLRPLLASGELPDDHLRAKENHDTLGTNNEIPQTDTSDGTTATGAATASSTYQPMKPVPKRHAVLGDVTEAMRTSYFTWIWQQEMKELELAYVGTKRNLFCIEPQFAMRDKPPTPPPEEEDPDEVECKIMSYYIDTMGSLPGVPPPTVASTSGDIDCRINQLPPAESGLTEPEIASRPPPSNPFGLDLDDDDPFFSAHDEDLRLPPPSLLQKSDENANSHSCATPNDQPQHYQAPHRLTRLTSEENIDQFSEAASTMETKFESQISDSPGQGDSKSKPKIDIVKVLNIIRGNQGAPSSSPSSSGLPVNSPTEQKHSEFWQNILGGNASSPSNVLPLVQAKDPRLKKSVEKSPHIDSDSNSVKASPDVNPDLHTEWKLYSISVPPIDYAIYSDLFQSDPKAKSDPRLNNFFAKTGQ